LNADQLLATLARRNEQLKQAEDHMAQLRAQLQQQQQQAEAQLAAAHSRQQAVQSRVAKQQDESMKQVIQLEVGRRLGQGTLGIVTGIRRTAVQLD
jgi:ABC-type transporter Mla subunit MlaD